MVGYPESLTDPSYQGQVSSSSSRSSFVVGVIIVRFVDRFVDRFLIIRFNRDFEKDGAFPQKLRQKKIAKKTRYRLIFDYSTLCRNIIRMMGMIFFAIFFLSRFFVETPNFFSKSRLKQILRNRSTNRSTNRTIITPTTNDDLLLLLLLTCP